MNVCTHEQTHPDTYTCMCLYVHNKNKNHHQLREEIESLYFSSYYSRYFS